MSPYATPAFEGLCTTYDIAKAAQEGCRAKKGLSALYRLKCRAEDVLRKNNRMGDISSSRRPPANAVFQPHVHSRGGISDSDDEGEEDELSHLDGSGKLRRMPESNTRKSPPTALGLARQVGAQGHAQMPSQQHDRPGRQASSGSQGHTQVPGRMPSPPMTGTAATFAHHPYGHHQHSNSLDLTSPLSDRSTATSVTLNDTWEGIVPPPPPMMMSLDEPPREHSRPGMTHHYSAPIMSTTSIGNGQHNMMYPPATPLTTAGASLQQQQAYSGNGATSGNGGNSMQVGSYEAQISPALSTATWSSFNVNAGTQNGNNGNGMNGEYDARSQHSNHVSHSGFTPQQIPYTSLPPAQIHAQGGSGQSVSTMSMISPSFSSHSQSLPSGTPLWMASNTLAGYGSVPTTSSGLDGLLPGFGGYSQTSGAGSGQGMNHVPGQAPGQGQMMGAGPGNGGWDLDHDLSMALGLELPPQGDDPLQGTFGTGMGFVDNDGLGTFNWNDLFGQSM